MGESRDDNPNVILTMVLVRIPAFREKETDVRSPSVPYWKCYEMTILDDCAVLL